MPAVGTQLLRFVLDLFFQQKNREVCDYSRTNFPFWKNSYCARGAVDRVTLEVLAVALLLGGDLVHVLVLVLKDLLAILQVAHVVGQTHVLLHLARINTTTVCDVLLRGDQFVLFLLSNL